MNKVISDIQFEDKVTCNSKSDFYIKTEHSVGDDYGINGGTFSFRMLLESGNVSIGTRLFNTPYKGIGMWFVIGNDSVTVEANQSKLYAKVGHDVSINKECKYAIEDDLHTIVLKINDTVVCSVGISDELIVFDSKGAIISRAKNDAITLAGYAKIMAKDFTGTIDAIDYDYTEIRQHLVERENRQVDYSTWFATDDLNRVTPDNSVCGDPKDRKYVGLFYFMCHVHVLGEAIRDHTKIYLEQGLDGLKEFLPKSHGGYWAEPYFGYYLSSDEWIYRKHAAMFNAAGIDFIFLDFSNYRTYPECHKILFDTWLKIRREGGTTPQIVPMCGEMPAILVIDMYTMWETIFSVPEYDELLFKWEGKPLVLGNTDSPDGDKWTCAPTTPQTREQFLETINSKEKIKEFYFSGKFAECMSKLTVRKCWAWQASRYEESKDFAGYWDWLDWHPQAPGRNFDGEIEQISVSMGTHAHTSTGRSFLGKKDYGTHLEDFDFTLGTAKYGLCFEQQFKRALEVDPKVIMITGWNEWYAGCIKRPGETLEVGHTKTDGYYLVDQFNPEFSRDGEPMKLRDGIGFGDNFYYQMVNYIRQFKGIKKTPSASSCKTINSFADWADVVPEYMDTLNDITYRRHLSWGGPYLYINNTGRNDLNYAKVTQDEEYLYFLITTANDIIKSDDTNWMNLFIDIDIDHGTGWEGYDFIVNRYRDEKYVSVERFVNNSWEFENIGKAEHMIDKNCLSLKISKRLLGIKGKISSFEFKWADNSTTTGDVMQFMDLGDTAPDCRFNFRYITD